MWLFLRSKFLAWVEQPLPEVRNNFEDVEMSKTSSVFERQKLGVHVQPYKDEVTLWNKVQ